MLKNKYFYFKFLILFSKHRPDKVQESLLYSIIIFPTFFQFKEIIKFIYFPSSTSGNPVSNQISFLILRQDLRNRIHMENIEILERDYRRNFKQHLDKRGYVLIVALFLMASGFIQQRKGNK